MAFEKYVRNNQDPKSSRTVCDRPSVTHTSSSRHAEVITTSSFHLGFLNLFSTEVVSALLQRLLFIISGEMMITRSQSTVSNSSSLQRHKALSGATLKM